MHKEIQEWPATAGENRESVKELLGEYVLLKSSVFGSLEAVIVDAQQDLTNKEKRLEARWGADRGGWLGDDGGMQQVQ